MRNVLFYRKYRRFHGGHLKVWNYFNHVRTAPGFDAQVLFDANSSWDATNPWHEARERVFDRVDQVSPDVLFIAGRDWQRLDALGLLDRDLPILNIIQHVRHAEDWSIQSRYLDRKAIRICVSDEVAEVVSGAGSRGAASAERAPGRSPGRNLPETPRAIRSDDIPRSAFLRCVQGLCEVHLARFRLRLNLDGPSRSKE